MKKNYIGCCIFVSFFSVFCFCFTLNPINDNFECFDLPARASITYNINNVLSMEIYFWIVYFHRCDVQALTGAGGVCFSWRIIERIRDTSFDVLDDFGLKSQSFAILSHSVPGSTSSASATNCFSAFLLITPNRWYKMRTHAKCNN